MDSNNSSEKEQYDEPFVSRRSMSANQASMASHHTMNQPPVPADRKHLEDVTNQTHQMQVNNIVHNYNQNINNNVPKETKALIIGPELSNIDPVSQEMLR